MDLTWGVLKKRQIFNLHKSGIYPSNFDVYYTTQKTQYSNWVLKLNLNIYIFVSLFVLLVGYCISLSAVIIA